VQRELGYLMDLVAALEQPTRCLVAQIMKAQISDAEYLARARKCRADALGIVGEDVLPFARLSPHDCPGFPRIAEAAVIAFPGGGVLGIAHQSGPCGVIVVRPFQPADFGLPACGGDRKLHDGDPWGCVPAHPGS